MRRVTEAELRVPPCELQGLGIKRNRRFGPLFGGGIACFTAAVSFLILIKFFRQLRGFLD